MLLLVRLLLLLLDEGTRGQLGHKVGPGMSPGPFYNAAVKMRIKDNGQDTSSMAVIYVHTHTHTRRTYLQHTCNRFSSRAANVRPGLCTKFFSTSNAASLKCNVAYAQLLNAACDAAQRSACH